MQILPVSQTNKVADYPYGRLRTEVTLSLDFNPKLGFRSVFQSINPKNGRVNAPKKSTYSDFMYQYIEDGTGHVKTGVFHVYDYKSINALCKLITENFEALQLNIEQLRFICAKIFQNLTISIVYSKSQEEKDILKEVSNTAKKGFLDGVIDFSTINIDVDKLKALENGK